MTSPSTEYRPMPEKPVWAQGPARGSAEADAPSGLIDHILGFVKYPPLEPYLFLDPGDQRLKDYVAGVESALNFIVDSLQEISKLKEPPTHGQSCLSRFQVERIIGRVPR